MWKMHNIREGRVMIDDNVVEFERPQIEPPKLAHAEFRLGNDGDLVLTVFDYAGHSVTLTYGLVSVPEDFDLEILHEAWGRWRLESPLVS